MLCGREAHQQAWAGDLRTLPAAVRPAKGGARGRPSCARAISPQASTGKRRMGNGGETTSTSNERSKPKEGGTSEVHRPQHSSRRQQAQKQTGCASVLWALRLILFFTLLRHPELPVVLESLQNLSCDGLQVVDTDSCVWIRNIECGVGDHSYANR
jgi:hypothetical protein